MRFASLSLLTLAVAFSLPASGQEKESILKQAVFSRSLAENQTPGEKTDTFLPDEAVYLSVELKGRPKSGVLGCRFLMESTTIGEAKVDLASTGKGMLAVVGPNAFAGFHLAPSNPLPLGSMYRAELSLDGNVQGSFPFHIAPPKGAIETKLKSTSFEKEVMGQRQPLEPEAALAPEDSVIFKGVADVGVGTWLRVNWLVNGKADPKGTNSHTMEENKGDCGFSFTFRPDNGWPVGKHEVSLVINGKEATRQSFTVKGVLPSRTVTPVIPIQPTGFALLRTNEKGDAATEVSAFDSTDSVLTAEWSLKASVKGTGIQYKWTQVDAGKVKDVPIGRLDVPDGIYHRLRTSLKLDEPAPVGRYRVDLLQNGKVIDSRPFEVR
jgi:hypothetical protein